MKTRYGLTSGTVSSVHPFDWTNGTDGLILRRARGQVKAHRLKGGGKIYQWRTGPVSMWTKPLNSYRPTPPRFMDLAAS